MLLLDQNQLEVKVVQNTGKGVFSKEEISAGKPVADYLGTVVPHDDEDTPNILYGFCRNSKDLIWPKDIHSSGAHTVNHSCAPNCMYYPYKGHILIVTLRKIFPNEQLTCEYFVDSGYLDEEGVEPNICYCDSVFCRGTLSAPKVYAEKFFKLVETPEMEEKLVEFKEEILPFQEYPEVVEPVKFMRLVGSVLQEPYDIENLLSFSIDKIKQYIRDSGRVLRDAKTGFIIAGVDYNNSLLCLR